MHATPVFTFGFVHQIDHRRLVLFWNLNRHNLNRLQALTIRTLPHSTNMNECKVRHKRLNTKTTPTSKHTKHSLSHSTNMNECNVRHRRLHTPNTPCHTVWTWASAVCDTDIDLSHTKVILTRQHDHLWRLTSHRSFIIHWKEHSITVFNYGHWWHLCKVKTCIRSTENKRILGKYTQEKWCRLPLWAPQWELTPGTHTLHAAFLQWESQVAESLVLWRQMSEILCLRYT